METMAYISAFEVPIEGGDFRGEYPSAAIPQAARTSAMEALLQGQTHYAPVSGVDALRTPVSKSLSDLGLDIPAERLIITGGEQEARFLAVQGTAKQYDDAAVARGDRQARFLAVHGVAERSFMAVPAVVHPGVQAALAVRNRQVAILPAARTFGLLPDIDAIREALAGGSNLIYLESPNRLTGFTYGAGEVEAISDLLDTYDALCIWDQTTAPAVMGHYVSLASIAAERTVAIGALWPGLGLASWQIGYVAAPTTYVEGLVALKQVMSICTSTPSQWAMVGAAQTVSEVHASLVAEMEAVRRGVLSIMPGDERVLIGQAVNILAFDLGDDAAPVLQRLQSEGIQVADGSLSGAPGVLRVTMKPNGETANVVRALFEGASS